jgi:hypothetical protein
MMVTGHFALILGCLRLSFSLVNFDSLVLPRYDICLRRHFFFFSHKSDYDPVSRF